MFLFKTREINQTVDITSLGERSPDCFKYKNFKKTNIWQSTTNLTNNNIWMRHSSATTAWLSISQLMEEYIGEIKCGSWRLISMLDWNLLPHSCIHHIVNRTIVFYKSCIINIFQLMAHTIMKWNDSRLDSNPWHRLLSSAHSSLLQRPRWKENSGRRKENGWIRSIKRPSAPEQHRSQRCSTLSHPLTKKEV